jgi:O-antigen ligase
VSRLLPCSERGFAEATLNPVGVAFANSCLAIVFVVLGILSKSLWRKSLFILAAALAFFVVLSSASRGAVIWSLGALGFFLVLNRHQRYLSPKGVCWILLGCALTVPVLVVLYKTNYGVAERIDVLFARFEQMFNSLLGRGHDMSLSARSMMWDYYLSNFGQWILIGEKGYTGYPHNQWIEIGARFGLLGVPMFLASIYIFGRLILSVLRRRHVHLDLEYSIIATLFVFGYLQSMTSLSLQVNRVLWLGFGYALGTFLLRRHGVHPVRR